MGIALSTGRTGPRRTQVRAALVLALGLVAAIALTQPTIPAHAAAADLSVTVSPSDARLPADEPTTFSVTVNNPTSAEVPGVKLELAPFGLVLNGAPNPDYNCTTDTAGGGNGSTAVCDVGTIPAAGKTFTFNGTSSAGTRTQTITVSHADETDATNNTISRKITFFDSVDLSTSIAHQDGNGGNLRAGDPVTIRVNVTNHGPDSATDVAADVGIPSWRSTSRDGRCTSAYVCSLGTMSDNESAELVFRGSFEPGRAQITSKVRDGSTLTDDTGGPNDSDTLTLAVDPAPKAPDDGDGDNGGDGNGGGPGDGDSTGGSGETSADNGSRGGASNPVELPSVTGGLAAPPALTGVGLGLPTVGNGVDLPMVGPNPAAPAGKGGPRADGADGTAKIVPPAILLALLMLLAWVALPALPSRRVRIRRR